MATETDICVSCGCDCPVDELIKIDGTHYNDKNWLRYVHSGDLVCVECYGK